MAKLNPQGLSRRNGSQQKCFVADPGYTFVFSDLGAAEPSVTAHYSKDPNYLLATQLMIGRRPYYNKDGMLVIDDIYLMVASRFPRWAEAIKSAFEADYNGVVGYDKWVSDPEYIAKKVLKSIRGQAKVICLALAYGLGAKKMTMISLQNGFEMTMAEARAFKKLYWDTFPLVDKLGKKLIIQYNSLGHIMNEFGYCLYPSSDHKVLNALIQSTVSGIMDLFNAIFFEKCPDALYVTVIHDEIVFMVKDELLEQVKAVFLECVEELNKTLNWSVPIRFGWDTSKTFDTGK
jgi:DNA polymerase I-like protein with 3'-5' exonuclease and polymerase domains